MSVSLLIQQNPEIHKRQALARVYALLLAEQKEAEAQAADLREMRSINEWLGLDDQDTTEDDSPVETSGK